MKTEKLRDALELLSTYICINEDHRYQAIHDAAQQELSELQRLVDVVKGFIEDNELREVGCIEGLNRGDMWVFINNLCNIVGYKE